MNNSAGRTTKCGPISEKMAWLDRPVEYRKLRGDASMIMSLTPQERASVASALSAERRQNIYIRFRVGFRKASSNAVAFPHVRGAFAG